MDAFYVGWNGEKAKKMESFRLLEEKITMVNQGDRLEIAKTDKE